MHDQPKLADALIKAVLLEHYGLSISALTFLPIGNDSASSVYRAQSSNGVTYFLKLRAGRGFSLQSLVIPWYLHDHGVPHVVGPLPTCTQDLWVQVNDYALSLYPFLDARVAADVGLTDDHWRALGQCSDKSMLSNYRRTYCRLFRVNRLSPLGAA